MKNLVKTLVVAGAMVTAGTAAADFSDIRFSLGADYVQTWMKGSNDKNNNLDYSKLFAKSYPGFTVYAGARVMENFGLELGYDQTTNKKKDTTDGADTLSMKTSKRGFHMDLVGFLPASDCIDVFASLGLGFVKPKLSATATQAGVTVDESAKGKNKTVLRLGLGASYMFTDMFGVRAKLGWENTKSLRFKDSNEKPFKDSITAALGLFAKF